MPLAIRIAAKCNKSLQLANVVSGQENQGSESTSERTAEQRTKGPKEGVGPPGSAPLQILMQQRIAYMWMYWGPFHSPVLATNTYVS